MSRWPRPSGAPTEDGGWGGTGRYRNTTPCKSNQEATALRASGDATRTPPARAASASRASARRRTNPRRLGRTGLEADPSARARRRPPTTASSGRIGGYTICRPRSLSACSRSPPSAVCPCSDMAHSLLALGPQVDIAQHGPQARESTGEARLDRAARAVQRLGHLRFRQVEKVPVGDDQTIVIRQSRERPQQRTAPLRLQGGGLGRGAVLRGGLGLGGAEQQGGTPAIRGLAIVRFIGDDAQQPRPEGTVLLEPGQGIVGLHKCLLRCILGLRGVSKDKESGARGQVLVPAYQDLVGAHVAAARPLDQCRILQAGPPPRAGRRAWPF